MQNQLDNPIRVPEITEMIEKALELCDNDPSRAYPILLAAGSILGCANKVALSTQVEHFMKVQHDAFSIHALTEAAKVANNGDQKP